MDYTKLEKIVLPNGLRILMMPDDRFSSASIGIWVGSGTRFEKDSNGGVSHFIEHMLFKGTPTRSSRDIAEQMDAVGGNINAYTTKEFTCFYAKSLRENLDVAVDILTDIVTAPKLDPQDIALEQGVVIEEIGMYEDSPEDVLVDALYQTIYPDNKLGTNILGTRESVAGLTAEKMRAHMAEQYTGSRMVVAVAGSFDRDTVISKVESTLGQLPSGDIPYEAEKAIYTPGCTIVKADFEQIHFCLGFEGIAREDERKYQLSILNAICGASTSSRMFQHIREERGLAYSVGSSTTAYSKEGFFAVDAGVGQSRQDEALAAIVTELCRLRKDGVTQEEFERAKNQSRASILMGLESTSSIASHIGRGELLQNRVRTEDEIISAINSVTKEQVDECARQFIDFDRLSLCAVGKVHDKKHYLGIVKDSIF